MNNDFLKDDIGHHYLKQQLLHIITENKIGHAYIFDGKVGSGALAIALSFAKLLVSLPYNDPYSMNDIIQSNEYRRANLYIHPDLHFSFPTIKKGDKKNISSEYIDKWREFLQKNIYSSYFDWLEFIGAENKQGNITVEECTEINHIISLKSFESKYKVLLMWMPELLGKEGNKLLKLIEEPPLNTVFLFVTERKELILETIISRCQIVKVPTYTNEEIISALLNLHNQTKEKAEKIAHIAKGNYYSALLLLDDSNTEWLVLIKNWLNFAITNQIEKLYETIEEIIKLGREKQKQFLNYFLHLIELTIQFRIHENIFFSDEEKDFTIKLENMLTTKQKEILMIETNKNIYYIERNANAKILFNAFSIKLFHLIKKNELISV